jgi:hypothetical protein
VLVDGVAAGGVNSLNITGGVAELVDGRVGLLSTICVCEGKNNWVTRTVEMLCLAGLLGTAAVFA